MMDAKPRKPRTVSMAASVTSLDVPQPYHTIKETTWSDGEGDEATAARARKRSRRSRMWSTLIHPIISIGADRDIWLILAINLFDTFSWVCFAYIEVLFLSDDYGYSDKSASWLYALSGILASIFSFTLGWILDVAGIKNTMYLGRFIVLTARVLLVFSRSRVAALVALLSLVPLGGLPLTVPSLQAALNSVTTEDNRSYALSLYVVTHNLGMMLAAPVVDLIRRYFSRHSSGPNSHYLNNEYRIIMMTTAASALIALVLSVFVRTHRVNVRAHRMSVVSSVSGVSRHTGAGSVSQPARLKKKRPTAFSSIGSTLAEKSFWKCFLLFFFMIGVSILHKNIEQTYPKYMVRTFGEDVAFASIVGIRPLLVIFLLPTFAPLSRFFSLFSLILAGVSITSLAPLWLALFGDQLWAGFGAVVCMSIGDALVDARLFEYVMKAAPKARQGLYLSLANLPSLVGRLFVGGMSGRLLETYCGEGATPENDECDFERLWLYVFGATVFSPLSLIVLSPFASFDDVNRTTDAKLLPLVEDLDEEEDGLEIGHAEEAASFSRAVIARSPSLSIHSAFEM